MSTWSGRKVRRLTNAVLVWKGDVCHLCDEPGANSADHDPPRSVLLREGVPDPDALEYLWPAHLLCNLVRLDRPMSEDLRSECRTKYLASLGRSPSSSLSPRFAARRPLFENAPTSGSGSPAGLSIGSRTKNPERRRTR